MSITTESTTSHNDQKAYTPGDINQLTLKNRMIKTATYEGMCPDGYPSEALIRHHERLAEGGVGMTTVAYCAVSPRGRTFADQMAMSQELLEPLSALTQRVHDAGAAVSIQLGHCGGFSKNSKIPKPHPHGPSSGLNRYGVMKGMFKIHEMDEGHIQGVIADFSRSARQAKEAGFDAVEIHLGHGYLLSQWLSPKTNTRTDRWGGSLENRLRLPIAVIRAVREEVGTDFPIITKNNLCDGFDGGADVDDAVVIARAMEDASVDAILMSGGFVSRTPFYLLRGDRPLRGMIEVEDSWLQKLLLFLAGPIAIQKYPFEEMFFYDDALRIREAVDIPLILLGGIVSRQNLAKAMEAGFEFVAMGRALIANPDLVQKFESGVMERSDCIHCNECMVEMDREGVRCILHSLSKTF